jgi:predicted DNA-binding transcriptional regulator AlpA
MEVFIMSNFQVQNKEILSREEAATFLGICKTTLDKLTIPRIKIRRRVLYQKKELDQWLSQNIQIRGEQK